MFTYIVDIANRVSEKMDVIICYSTRKETPLNFHEYFNENIKLIKVENFTRNINPVKDVLAILEVRKIVKQEKPDIVHMHSSKAGAIGRLCISSKNIELFYTPHSYAFCKKDDSKIKRCIYKAIEMILGKRKCTTIACSESEYEEALKISKNSIYINNGINPEEIDKYIANEPQKIMDTKNLKICTVGRIGHQKNPKMFNKIAENFSEILFTWIGDGELKHHLRTMNTDVFGWCDREKAIKELNKNDILILTSLWEGLPITLLEAMYLGKICIVSNVSGNKDVIKNGVNGFICEDEEQYCNIIQKIKSGQIDCLSIKNMAKEYILQNHNINKVAEKYLEIYCKGDDCY